MQRDETLLLGLSFPIYKVRNLRLPNPGQLGLQAQPCPLLFSLPVPPCWCPCSALLGAAGLLRGGEARHLLIHEYSGWELEPPLGSPASHQPLWPPSCLPEPRLLTYPAAARPQLFTLFVQRSRGFSKPRTCFGGRGGCRRAPGFLSCGAFLP